jgi:hypothetical protein
MRGTERKMENLKRKKEKKTGYKKKTEEGEEQ